MNRILFRLILIIMHMVCQAQDSPFLIEHIKMKDFENITSLKTKNSSHFYENDLYTVDKTCNGEFGGQVTFTDKKTGKKYSCSSTCAITLNKLNNSYYITSTLAHKYGTASVQVVKNPKLLEVISVPEVLVQGSGILTLGSFIYDNKLFHIITNRDKTYVAEVLNKNYINLAIILEESLFMYNPTMTKNANGDYIIKIQYLTNKLPLARKKIEGYIVVNENKIQVVRK